MPCLSTQQIFYLTCQLRYWVWDDVTMFGYCFDIQNSIATHIFFSYWMPGRVYSIKSSTNFVMLVNYAFKLLTSAIFYTHCLLHGSFIILACNNAARWIFLSYNIFVQKLWNKAIIKRIYIIICVDNNWSHIWFHFVEDNVLLG